MGPGRSRLNAGGMQRDGAGVDAERNGPGIFEGGVLLFGLLQTAGREPWCDLVARGRRFWAEISGGYVSLA